MINVSVFCFILQNELIDEIVSCFEPDEYCESPGEGHKYCLISDDVLKGLQALKPTKRRWCSPEPSDFAALKSKLQKAKEDRLVQQRLVGLQWFSYLCLCFV